jgi:RNA polymerase subunit RPABC4/transcription elongation factor Spt4
MKTKPLVCWEMKSDTGPTFQYCPRCERGEVDEPWLDKVLVTDVKRYERLSEVLFASGGACFGCSPPKGSGGIRRRGNHQARLAGPTGAPMAPAGCAGKSGFGCNQPSCDPLRYLARQHVSNPRSRTRIRGRGR